MTRTKALIGLAALALAAAGCDSVTAPTSDSSAPTLTWHVENRTTGTTQDITGSGKVMGAPGDDFRITLKAIDPEGIYKIDLNGGYTETCTGSDHLAQQED